MRVCARERENENAYVDTYLWMCACVCVCAQLPCKCSRVLKNSRVINRRGSVCGCWKEPTLLKEYDAHWRACPFVCIQDWLQSATTVRCSLLWSYSKLQNKLFCAGLRSYPSLHFFLSGFISPFFPVWIWPAVPFHSSQVGDFSRQVSFNTVCTFWLHTY